MTVSHHIIGGRWFLCQVILARARASTTPTQTCQLGRKKLQVPTLRSSHDALSVHRGQYILRFHGRSSSVGAAVLVCTQPSCCLSCAHLGANQFFYCGHSRDCAVALVQAPGSSRQRRTKLRRH
eukprot:6189189-Pleurochrysis_carterae.AAC.1